MLKLVQPKRKISTRDVKRVKSKRNGKFFIVFYNVISTCKLSSVRFTLGNRSNPQKYSNFDHFGDSGVETNWDESTGWVLNGPMKMYFLYIVCSFVSLAPFSPAREKDSRFRHVRYIVEFRSSRNAFNEGTFARPTR